MYLIHSEANQTKMLEFGVEKGYCRAMQGECWLVLKKKKKEKKRKSKLPSVFGEMFLEAKFGMSLQGV